MYIHLESSSLKARVEIYMVVFFSYFALSFICKIETIIERRLFYFILFFLSKLQLDHNTLHWMEQKTTASTRAQFTDLECRCGNVWDSIPGPVKSDTVSSTDRHRCDVSSELCCPGAEPRNGSRHSLHASA